MTTIKNVFFWDQIFLKRFKASRCPEIEIIKEISFIEYVQVEVKKGVRY